MSDEPLLTSEQLAVRLQVSCYTIWEWTRAGRIPAIRMSKRCLRFRLSEVLEALKERAPKTTTGGKEKARNR